MAKTKTSLKEGDNLPPRGQSNKTRILNAIRSESVKSLVGLSGEPTKDEAETAFFAHVAKRAFNIDDKDSAQLIKVLADKGWASVKSTLDTVAFDFPSDGTPAEKAFSVVDAISNGSIPPDIGQTIISIIKDSVVIEESTDLKFRLEEIEKAMGLNNV